MDPEISETLLKRLKSINTKFSIYKNFSPDDLRVAARTIEKSISSAKDEAQALENKLEDVFAIVKATAYLFSQGNIEVKANDFDRFLATKFDFVQIAGDKAIYLNTWEAGGEKMTWKMVHYDEQLLGGIYLHNGYATEMATGEGKTLVATLPIMLNAFTHKGVHVMTVNDYLSRRDCEITRPLYMFHGLTVGCIEYYERLSLQGKSAYKSDITFGTISGFTFDYLYDHMAMCPEDCVQQNHNYAVVDELDSVMIDNADTPHVVGGGLGHDVGMLYKEFKPLFEQLYNSADASEMFISDKLNNIAYYTEKGKRWIANKTEIKDLFKFTKKYQIAEYQTLASEEQREIDRKFNIQRVFEQLLSAYTLYEKDVHYIVEMGRVIIVDQHTGRTKENSRWRHGLHTAIEVKENVRTMEDFDGIAVISLKNFFKLYKKCAGMSGTIMPVAEELEEVYGLKCVSLPTHKPMIRKDMPLRVYKNKAAKDRAIVETIKELNKTHRPVLVGSISIMRSYELSKLLNLDGIKHVTLNAKSEENEAKIISYAGREDSIVLSTSMAGRGTDIKLSPKSKESGGLAVIGTDMFESSRVDRQLMGRSGRQGDPGSSVFFASLDDFIVQNLSTEDWKALSEEATKTEGEEISTSRIIELIYKAQKNREKFFHTQRMKTARKDDIIAPHRRKFYDERNEVLHNPQVANAIVENLLPADMSCDNMNKYLEGLYQHAKALTEVSQSNNKIRTMIDIPFSENLKLYSVKFEIKQLRESFEYFCTEYKRQVILRAYDKYWKRFVTYMMEDLDQTETEALETKYKDMKREINNIILSRMMKATIPVGGVGEISIIENSEENSPKLYPADKGAPFERLGKEQLCPCGSGKIIGECHLMRTHHRRRR